MLCIALLAAATLPFVSSHIIAPRTNCSELITANLKPYNASILSSVYFNNNTRNATGGTSGTLNNIAFCELKASISYGTNNTLNFETWLPDSYEDRFIAVGNGGMAGTIDRSGMMDQLNTGLHMAVAGGDAGHLASENQNVTGYLPYLHDTEQVAAWIHDAISLFTPAARAVAERYYGAQPRKSFYYGCSTGGAQGFALAERHPELFDGIYAGCPGNWYSHLALSFLWNAQHTNTPAANLTEEDRELITNAVVKTCDEDDGVADGLIENPLACKFDIDSLACKNNSSTACLTKAKLAAVKAIYAGPKRRDTGAEVYPGFTFGSEIEWEMQQGSLSRDFSVPILKNVVFNDQGYDNGTFNWATDVDKVDAKAGRFIDSINPDLSAFRRRGGKLLTSQGWADPYNAATWPIEHREQVKNAMGGCVEDFYRLVMIPGGGHCGAASGYPDVPATNSFIAPLVKWVESEGEVAPAQFLSSSPPQGGNRTRKLCVWPAVAQYEGGDVDDWTSYTCT
ncbi:putative tannase/feruloyl esterase, alpha/Beta hydrolase [Septoria linicola]|nr:putative tannase/feruloyl esterase, alpha/Beta hydrolase [Septoria linicola]